MDLPMEEVFIIASAVKEKAMQDFIPVHVFPIRYNVKKSVDYLSNITKDNAPLQAFNNNIKSAFDYFETKKKLPIIMVNQKGEYVLYQRIKACSVNAVFCSSTSTLSFVNF